MNTHEFSQWFDMLSPSAKIKAVALIYSKLTINARELFVPEWARAREQRILEILHGLNEIHHTLSNYLLVYASDERTVFPSDALGQQLAEIENKYRLGHFLIPAIESARTSS